MRHGDRLDGDADVDGHHIDPHHLPRDNDHRHSSLRMVSINIQQVGSYNFAYILC